MEAGQAHLEELGSYEFQCVDGSERLAELLAEGFEVEAAGCVGRGGTPIAANEATPARFAPAYEFLGSDEDYKLIWTERCRDRGRVQAFPRTATGLAQYLACGGTGGRCSSKALRR